MIASGFEYKICTQLMRLEEEKDITDTESMLNKLGKEKWELVSSHPIGGSYKIEYVFKRPRY
jgi:hypothetical protein